MNNKLKHDLDQAINIINNLIDGIQFMPLSWDETVGVGVSDNIKQFMSEHDPENWGTINE